MQKEWRLCRKKLLLLTMPDKVKGEVFRESQMGDHKLAYSEQITNFPFWFSLTLKLFSAYMENTLNREKKCRSISTNIRPKQKIFKIIVSYPRWFERSKKSSHATVPLRV
jgi:hypothetical protein